MASGVARDSRARVSRKLYPESHSLDLLAYLSHDAVAGADESSDAADTHALFEQGPDFGLALRRDGRVSRAHRPSVDVDFPRPQRQIPDQIVRGRDDY